VTHVGGALAIAAVAVSAALTRVELYRNTGDGMFVDNSANAGTSKATVVDSVSANNVNHGFIAGGGGAFLTIIHSASIGNNNFVVTFDAGTVLRFGHSTLSRNIAS